MPKTRGNKMIAPSALNAKAIIATVILESSSCSNSSTREGISNPIALNVTVRAICLTVSLTEVDPFTVLPPYLSNKSHQGTC